ncbi:hypothetical protein DOTSEDRAFT_69494 [Dothistroma septosporum NZE10]|uniref:Zn(2)-C6 fungal-type domain-containing protein n=1 Tax=Dothistroma septosporum (strain NZE10 / CBS 128990) TaxID=675120 RepID=N1PW03_DOTSN|nr:hypothetical protein DOTSEDRAFT_69494 [Dothistroma septosporum NZE10]
MESTGSAMDTSKRKRSPSISNTGPPPKSAKTGSQLSINYLARQSHDDLPLINKEDALPNLLHLLSAYSNILDRHESLASNLGARPLGPILIKRFERCFETAPKVVATHQKNSSGNPEDGSQITWLEVIEFARSHPSQFTLSTFSEGKRVCQFYYPQKQLRVQISEEDFLFINSGRCQELIPPLPIWEDEEKEVGTCDVLEAKLKELTNAADMVAARTRQLSHRLKGRRAAILERRAEGGSGTPAKANAVQTTTAPSSSSGSSFVAVNSSNGPSTNDGTRPEPVQPSLGSSAAVRNELLRHFESLPHNQGSGRPQGRHYSVAEQSAPRPSEVVINHHDGVDSNASSLSPVPPNAFNNETLPYAAGDSIVPSRTQSVSHVTTQGHRSSFSVGGGTVYNGSHVPMKHNFSRPLPPALESSQPFRPLCQAHMDGLPRGQRVLPPCDRCRRLRMDCVKNLTSCAGCTRKHARCHWRDVSRDELGALDHLMDSVYPASMGDSPSHESAHGNGYLNGGSEAARSESGENRNEDSDEDDSNPLEDLEALDAKEEQEMQIREDEEGLANARQLARQGWEVGQDGQAGDGGLASEAAQSASMAIHSLPDGAQQDPLEDRGEQAPDSLSLNTKRPSHDQAHDESHKDYHEGVFAEQGNGAEPLTVAGAESNGVSSVHLGEHQAVNNDAGDSVTASSGWRAV